MKTYITRWNSPVGPLRIVCDDAGRLLAIDFHAADETASSRRCSHVTRQLREYFAGKRRGFDLELAAAGTPFQTRVWDELRRIPFGETISYAQLARRINKPLAVRAVGRANGANPIPIVVPCHRVVGSNGKLTGFGGGIDVKCTLLAIEGVESTV